MIKCYVDEYSCLCPDDPKDEGPWRFNIVPVESYPDCGDWEDMVEVSQEEYDEFIEIKGSLSRLQ